MFVSAVLPSVCSHKWNKGLGFKRSEREVEPAVSYIWLTAVEHILFPIHLFCALGCDFFILLFISLTLAQQVCTLSLNISAIFLETRSVFRLNFQVENLVPLEDFSKFLTGWFGKMESALCDERKGRWILPLDSPLRINLLAWAQPSYVNVSSRATVEVDIGNACNAITPFRTKSIARLVGGPIREYKTTFKTEGRKYVFSTATRKSAILDTRHATSSTMAYTALSWLCKGVVDRH